MRMQQPLRIRLRMRTGLFIFALSAVPIEKIEPNTYNPNSIAPPKRSSDTLCVVKDARDVIFMERMREYHGRYHVLGGVLSPMDGIGPEMLRINELCKRIECEKVKEVILATNPDVEGETTANYIAKLLKPLGVRVTRIAHGIPIGGSLEYIDEVTLLRSIENRREM